MTANLRAIFLRHLGKRANKYWKDALCDIVAVHQGVKPGFLFDYGAVIPRCLASLVHDVIQSVCRSETKDKTSRVMTKLCIISLGQDVILANTSILHHTLDNNRNKMALGVSNIINVSAHLSSPEILSLSSSSTCAGTQQFIQGFSHLYAQFKTNLQSSVSVEDTLLSSFEVDNVGDFNLTTVFGLLVGYPVLYWFEGGSHASNCLEMVPLRVYEVLCDVFIPRHYSESSHMQDFNQLDATKHTVAVAGVETKERHQSNDLRLQSKHVLFSFSIPECVADEFDEVIALWFQNVLLDSCSSALIKELRLSKKSISLPSVAL